MEYKASRVKWIQAGLLYFAMVFGAGFALGLIRTLWAVPWFGTRMAELMEMPLMIAVTVLACRSVIRRFAVAPGWPRFGMGTLALSMLVAAELALNAWILGRPVSAFITERDPVSGSAYFIALGLFGIMPFLIAAREPPGSSVIDAFIDRPDVSESHQTVVCAPADLVFDVAEHFDLLSVPAIKAIFGLRERVFRVTSKPRVGPRGIVAETKAMGWGVLAYRPGREIVMGAVTQPWLGDVKFRPVPSGEFRSFSEADFVKIAWTLEAEPIAPSVTRFHTQTRVLATDKRARRKFRIYWMFAGLFIVLIRRIGNRAIRREAERRIRAGEYVVHA